MVDPSKAVGIDLGTTYSCVAVYKPGSADAEIIANDQGNRTTPSYVAFTETERLIGDPAKNQVALNPSNTVYDAKRLIGRKFNDDEVKRDVAHFPFTVVEDPKTGKPRIRVQFKDEQKEFLPEEISAMVLTKMKETAEAYLGGEVSSAVITVPAYFNDAQRQSTKDAALIAGLNVLRIINEPTAAAIAYGMGKVPRFKKRHAAAESAKVQQPDAELTVLIFDLGGGTFDVSLLTIEGGVFEVKATSGDTHLGGEDFDNIMVDYFSRDFKTKYGKDITKVPRALRRLRTACERAKRVLSSSTQTSIEIDSLMDGIDYYVPITRAKFEDMCKSKFAITLEVLDKVFSGSSTSKSSVDEIVLVGGSTRIPKIQEMVSKFFNNKPVKPCVNPDEAVAAGAAVQAFILAGGTSEATQDVLLIDVTPVSLGIETAGGVMTSLIKSNTPVPARRSEMFSTFSDYQTSVSINVYEGERAMVKDCNKLGTFDLNGIPPAPRNVPHIQVTFDVDTDGLLNVSAVDKSSGNTGNIVITNAERLTTDQIEKMRDDAVRYKAEDDMARAKVKARNDLESMAYSIRSNLADTRLTADIPKDEVDSLKSTVDEVISWVDSHPDATESEYRSKYDDLMKASAPVTTKMHASSGGPGGPAPGGNPGAAAGGGPGSASGPTVEEVD